MNVRIACAQIAPRVGDSAGNRRLAGDALREAIGAGAHIVLLPELATSGYVFESAEEARGLALPAEELSDWAEELSESELRALRDPRNWVRPLIAVGAGGVATGALVVIEMRRRGRQQTKGGLRSIAERVRP